MTARLIGRTGEEQLELPFRVEEAPRRRRARPAGAPPEDALGAACARLFPRRDVEVRYHEAQSTLLTSWREEDGVVVLRAQGCFRWAPPEVAEALARLNLGRPRSEDRRRLSHRVHAWHLIEAPPAPSLPASKLRGARHHDLAAVLVRVRRRHLPGLPPIDVGLAARPARRIMGRHERRSPRSLVLLNPLLDHPEVEPWYLEYLVFHEGLHELIPPRCVNGRIQMHPREFRIREHAHPDFPAVRSYERWLTGPGWIRLREACRPRAAARP